MNNNPDFEAFEREFNALAYKPQPIGVALKKAQEVTKLLQELPVEVAALGVARFFGGVKHASQINFCRALGEEFQDAYLFSHDFKITTDNDD